MKATLGCTCPHCRKGYIPKSYTFGGNVPPERPMTSADVNLAETIRHMERWRDEIDAKVKMFRMPKGPKLGR